MRSKITAFVALFVLVFLAVTTSQGRVWTSGSYTVKGEFVGYLSDDGGTVRVRKDEDGTVVRMKIRYLSQADKDYVRQQMRDFQDSRLRGASGDAVSVKSIADVPKNRRYALLIGVNDYSKERLLSNLSSPVKDMKDLKAALVTHLDFDPANITLIVDENAPSGQPTRAAIMAAVDKIVKTVPQDAVLFVAFSGHGVMIDIGSADVQAKSYLCVRDTSFSGETAEEILKTVIDRDTFFAKIDRCRAQQKIFFSDACRNKISTERIQQLATRSIKGFRIVENKDDDLIRNWNYNYVLFSSCAPGECSIDAGSNGLFIKYLLEGLNDKKAVRQDGKLTVFSWFEYAADRTIEESNKMIASGSCRVPAGQSQQTPKIRCPSEMSMVVLAQFNPAADPNDIVVRRYKIGPLKVTINPVSAFGPGNGAPTRGKFNLPPLPPRIVELSGTSLGIEAAIKEMEAGTHEAQADVQQTIREAKNQYSVLYKQRNIAWKGLPTEVQSQLKTRLAKEPTAHPTEFLSLKPNGLLFSEYIKMILWGQKTEQAREEMTRVELEAKSEIAKQIAKMKANKRRNDDLIAQEKAKFCKTVLLKIMSRCKDYERPEGKLDYVLLSDVIPVMLNYKLDWQKSQLYREAKRLWDEERPCVLSEQKKPSTSKLSAVPPDSGSQAGERMTKTVNGVEFAFRWCPAGTFTMGSPELEEGRDVETQRRVTLKTGFWMQETEITQAQWKAVMGTTIQDQAKKMLMDDTEYEFDPFGKKTMRDYYGFRRDENPDRAVLGVGNDHPMYYVNWNECVDFCRNLSSKLGVKVQLPTEVQWEYAYWAGTQGDISHGDMEIKDEFFDPTAEPIDLFNDNNPVDYIQNSPWDSIDLPESHHPGDPVDIQPVEKTPPNAWGLYGMYGNVFEWCRDRLDSVSQNSVVDPKSPKSGSLSVICGDDWRYVAHVSRLVVRFSDTPERRDIYLGFRVSLGQ